jgi:hypothetical protein
VTAADAVEVTPAPRIGGGTGLTIVMWVRAESDTSWVGLLDASNARRQHADAIDLRLNVLSGSTPTRAMLYHLSGITGWGQVAVTNPPRFPLHTWTHVALVQTTSSAAIYWNGTLQVSSGTRRCRPPWSARTTL